MYEYYSEKYCVCAAFLSKTYAQSGAVSYNEIWISRR